MQLFSHTLALSFAKLRMSAPAVHCIPNPVALDLVTNVLLAFGVRPVILQAGEEINDAFNHAQCLMISTDALSAQRAALMLEAAKTAKDKNIPWALDLRGAGEAQFRDKTIYELLNFQPRIVRITQKEVMPVAEHYGFTAKGSETIRTSEEQVEATKFLAKQLNSAIVMTGAVDFVADSTRILRIMNGHPLMAKVAGAGCALVGVMAAFCVIEEDALLAAAVATGVYNIIGEIAGNEASAGPGSFRAAFIDKIYNVDTSTSMRRLKVL